MQVDLKGQVAWVTGGGGGIGRAICEVLAANGAAVAVLDMNEGAAKEARRGAHGQGLPRPGVASRRDRQRESSPRSKRNRGANWASVRF